MRIQTDCLCGASFTIDDGGRDDVCTRQQFNDRHASWNTLHAKCLVPRVEVKEKAKEELELFGYTGLASYLVNTYSALYREALTDKAPFVEVATGNMIHFINALQKIANEELS